MSNEMTCDMKKDDMITMSKTKSITTTLHKHNITNNNKYKITSTSILSVTEQNKFMNSHENSKMNSTEEPAFEKLFSTKINGQKTDFVFQRFKNTYFLIITQYQKMVNLYNVKIDTQGMLSPLIFETIPLTITSVFGTDTDEQMTAVKFITNNSKLRLCPKEILISIGLKQINKECLNEICTILNEILPEATEE